MDTAWHDANLARTWSDDTRAVWPIERHPFCINDLLYIRKENMNSHSFDEEVRASDRRMACRGNGTSFPLPWQDLGLI